MQGLHKHVLHIMLKVAPCASKCGSTLAAYKNLNFPLCVYQVLFAIGLFLLNSLAETGQIWPTVWPKQVKFPFFWELKIFSESAFFELRTLELELSSIACLYVIEKTQQWVISTFRDHNFFFWWNGLGNMTVVKWKCAQTRRGLSEAPSSLS